MNSKKKLLFYEILSFIVMLLPILIVFIVKWDEYTKENNGMTLCLAGVICVFFFILLVKGKFKLPTQQVFSFAIFFGLVCILEPLLKDLKLISLMALIGQLAYTILFEFKVQKLRKQVNDENLANLIVSSIQEK